MRSADERVVDGAVEGTGQGTIGLGGLLAGRTPPGWAGTPPRCSPGRCCSAAAAVLTGVTLVTALLLAVLAVPAAGAVLLAALPARADRYARWAARGDRRG